MSASTLPSPALFPFGPLQIAYDGDLLRPRAWTIEQSRWAIDLAPALPDGPILELCCGAGQIGLLVGHETGRPLVQVDDHDDACGFARINARNAGVESDVRCARLTTAVRDGERFPIILADPPYIPTGETDEHADDPEHAIDGGRDGLDVARTCLDVARRHLAPGGAILLQLGGADQAEALGIGDEERREFAPDRTVVLLR
jgi:methylase of polypeptide subunit release factors